MEFVMSTPSITETRALLAAFQLGTECLFAGEVDAAVKQLREGIVLADKAGTPALRTNGRVTLARALLLAGNLRDAIRVTEQAEASWVRTASEPGAALMASPAAAVLPLRASALLFMGRATDAEAVLDRARSIALEHGDHRLLAVVRAHGALTFAAAGDGERALAEAEASLGACAGDDRPSLRAMALDAFARAQVANGTPLQGLGVQREAIALSARDRAARAQDAWLEAGLAELQLALGDAPAALATANRAVAKARRLGTRVYEIAALLARAAAALALPDADATLGGSLLRVHSLIETTEARLFEMTLARTSATLERRMARSGGCGQSLAA
jgi:ATP/maltotriose-dependent transcriptional regulator MalT